MTNEEPGLDAKAADKQMPKKPIWTRQGFFEICPTCKAYVDGVYNPNYCGNCGQKLDRKGEET